VLTTDLELAWDGNAAEGDRGFDGVRGETELIYAEVDLRVRVREHKE